MDGSWHAMESQNFLSKVSENLLWLDISNDTVMDIGCGVDKNICELIVKFFPDVKKVIGFDSNREVIFKLQVENTHQKNVEYHYADIEHRSTLIRWEGKINKVVSSHCFHQIPDKETAFRNVYRLLTTDGEASFTFCLHSADNEWCIDLIKNPKWSFIYKGTLDRMRSFYPEFASVSYYKDMLERIGFTVIYCETEERCIPFPSDEISKEDMIETLSTFDIPSEMKEDIYKDAFEYFLKRNKRNAEGKPCCRYSLITIMTKKTKRIPT